MPSFLLLKFTLIVLIAISLSPSSVQGQDVFTALKNANAGQYASRVKANPALANLISTGQVGNIFAPIDTPGQKLQKRGPLNDGLGLCKKLSGASETHKRDTTLPSADFTTADSSVPANLGGRNQALVSGGGTTIYAGLGQFVTIMQSSIPFDGGLIYTVTGSLAVPDLLTTTISENPDLSHAAAAINRSGLASTLNAVPSTTFFIPDNEAFASLSEHSGNDITIINDHVVEGTVSYLPDFKNGQVLTTASGTTLTITIVNGAVFVNDAIIVTPNLILENGVAHVIDKVLFTSSNSTSTAKPTTTPTGTNTTSSTSTSTTSPKAPLFTGGAMSLLMTTGFVTVVASTVGSVLLPMLF